MVTNHGRRAILVAALAVASAAGTARTALAEDSAPDHVYRDAKVAAVAQAIPGIVYCAYYDLGGEGVAYHDTEPKNLGSGTLNPADGSYLNEFRRKEGVDISYTKFRDAIDDNPFNRVQPDEGLLYVGWTAPGEWFNMTVNIAKPGRYQVDLLYTSNRGGTLEFDLDGKPLAGPLRISSTSDSDDPVAWRQWHHWDKVANLTEVELPSGLHVFTVRIVTEGNMNLATLDFHRAE